MKKSHIIIIVVGIFLVLLIWGLVGSSQSAKLGTDCDIGIGKDGSVLCWKWHQNFLGELGNRINEAIN